MTIKAIETRYKGYRFRSRLEARWAVFFDAMGLDWEYEPEGFDLGGGLYYLPDFRINKKIYVEVKGGMRDGVEPSVDDKRKIMNFANQIDFDESIIVLGDMPPAGKEHLFLKISKRAYASAAVNGHILVGNFCFWGMYSIIDNSPDDLWRFARIPDGVNPMGYRIGMCNWQQIENRLNTPICDSANKFIITNCFINTLSTVARVDDAYNKARAARFEHGEQG